VVGGVLVLSLVMFRHAAGVGCSCNTVAGVKPKTQAWPFEARCGGLLADGFFLVEPWRWLGAVLLWSKVWWVVEVDNSASREIDIAMQCGFVWWVLVGMCFLFGFWVVAMLMG
jgi:hypothetical protein